METNIIINKDSLLALKELPDESINCCVTSPPYYGLRDYGVDGQIGREQTPERYIERLIEVFNELHRVMRSDGTFWLNIADTYCCTGSNKNHHDSINPKGRSGQQINTHHAPGCKHKDLIGIPWLLAFALRSQGWYLRSDIIWQKGNPMPESIKDRPTRSYEHIFLLAKSKKYYYNALAIKEPALAHHKVTETRNRRDIWYINTVPYRGAHIATFPPKLVELCILAGCPKDGIVIDTFFGSGTTGLVAAQLERRYIGIELNPDYCSLAEERISNSNYLSS